MRLSKLFFLLPVLVAGLCLAWAGPVCGSDEGKKFVGSGACAECHDEIYERFTTHSKKAHTRNRVEKMIKKLTRQEQDTCYQCHTTGYGKPGGFVSYAATPQLADIGCETCHGPGSLHAESGDIEDIQRRPAIEQCNVCHNSPKVNNSNFKPLLYSGAH